MRVIEYSIVGAFIVLLTLAACGNQEPAVEAAMGQAGLETTEAFEARPFVGPPAAEIATKPHPAQMATHCLRVAAAAIGGTQREECVHQRLWVSASNQRGPLSDSCLINRLTLEAFDEAKSVALIPDGGFLSATMLATSDCIESGQFARFQPYAYGGGEPTEGDSIEFIGYALRVIGEDRKWSPTFGSINTTDVSILCRYLDVATDRDIRSLANEALDCLYRKG
jgi:hypothetical protein